jgi:hypothetical protein
MGDLEKTRLETPECDFSGALREKDLIYLAW